MAGTITESDRRYDIPGTAQVVEGNGGLPKVSITTNEVAGEMYLHGAHVTSWQPAGGEEVLFLSSQTRWEDGRAIRGGVPICFPWFGGKADDPKAPAHGFARTKAWQLESIGQVGGTITVSLFTESNESTRKWWPADFRLVHRATFGRELTLELVMTNTGKMPLRFEEALHAYFKVGNVEDTRVVGLDSVDYLDKVDADLKKSQHGAISIVSETDRVYLNTSATVEVEDPALHRRIRIAKGNSRSTVVWNPWVRKAHSLSDLGDEEWRQMICIETCNVAAFAVDLAPGERHAMRAAISVGTL